jgi:hypothetical protein
VCCNRNIPAEELIADARGLKLLGKDVGGSGCIVESGGGDREIEVKGSSRVVDLGDIIDLCGDDEEQMDSDVIVIN